MLRGIFGPKRESDRREVGENYIIRSVMTCTLRQT
jgi:hypothetical protein